MYSFNRTIVGFFLGIIACVAVICCAAIKPEVNAPCPANAVCDAIDFGGAVTFTACLSADDMPKLQALATERRNKLLNYGRKVSTP